MPASKAVQGLGAVVGGVVFFVSAVLFSLSIAMWNAKVTPSVPWFPIPVLGVLYAVVFWINRRWNIGLAVPRGLRWGQVIAFAIFSMIATHCVLILEGAFHGITREFEAAPDGVTPFFAFVYWVGVVIAMSTASEAAFRGIIQSRLTPLYGVGVAIFLATFVNWISHRWDGLIERSVGVITILFAWSVLRHLSGSLTPTILTHIGTILVWDAILWYFGPWDHSAMGTGALVATALIGLVSLAGALWAAKGIRGNGLVGAGGGLASRSAL